LLKPQLFVFVVLPELEILNDLDSLDITVGKRLSEKILHICKWFCADWDVVSQNIDPFEIL
jgi:hypothetical protein